MTVDNPVRAWPEFRVGIGAGPTSDGPALAAKAVAAERAGFAWFGSGEHVMFHNPTSSALINLSYVAAVTDRIGLLTSVVLAPLYPAALLAKLTAALAVLSAGRLCVGVGVGGEYPAEFEACGVDIHDRGARLDETIDVLTTLWSGERLDHEGRFWTVHGAIAPTPATPPELWIAGRRPAALRRAVTKADVWMPYLVRAGRLREQLDTLASAERPVRTVPYLFVRVDTDGDRARAEATRWLGAWYHQSADAFADLVIAGDADECLARLNELHAWGCAGVQVVCAGPPEMWHEQVQLLGDDVLPRLDYPPTVVVTDDDRAKGFS